MSLLRHAPSGLRRVFHSAAAQSAVLGGFASSLTLEFGSPHSKFAGMDGALLGAGNPLLDISAVVTQELLDKYEVRVSRMPWC